MVGDAKGNAAPGWWAKLDPRRKRMVAIAGLGGVLAVIYLMSQRSSAAAAAVDPTATDYSGDTSAAGADAGSAGGSSGVPGAWDYGGVTSPYPYQGGGYGQQNNKLSAQIAMLIGWLKKHPPGGSGDPHGPPVTKPPQPKPPPKPKPKPHWHPPPHHKPPHPPHDHGHHHGPGGHHQPHHGHHGGGGGRRH